MPSERTREDLLRDIKKAELDAARREDGARAIAAKVRAEAQSEAARIVEEAEREGRALMRRELESAKAACSEGREAAVGRTAASDADTEERAGKRIPLVSDFMLLEFRKELDAED